ncbi:MAG: helix-turn-helix domain-containing protein [Polyangia bacterium]
MTDDDLLDAARAVFLARGVDATTTEIARRARISESVIFHRYKTKEALFSAVFERQIVMPPSLARLPSSVGIGEIADNLFDAGMGVVEMTQSVLPFMMMSLSSVKMNVLHKHARKPHPLKRQMIELVSAYCESEGRAGRLRRVKGEILARTFLGGIMQYVMSEYVERSAEPAGVQKFLRGLIDLLLRGALPEKPARRRR